MDAHTCLFALSGRSCAAVPATDAHQQQLFSSECALCCAAQNRMEFVGCSIARKKYWTKNFSEFQNKNGGVHCTAHRHSKRFHTRAVQPIVCVFV